MTKKDTIPLDPIEEARYDRKLERAERNKRRRIQNKTKGSRASEAKIVELTEERNQLQEKLGLVTKLLRIAIKLLPSEARVEFEQYRVRFNGGDIEDVHP